MRIVAGRLKGRTLLSPTWEGLRPTSDWLRESLFNILRDRVDGAQVVDACAGTGALGLEAWSRGARHVVFVEQDRRAVTLIERNLALCGVRDGYTIVPVSMEGAGELVAAGTAELVLLDPPYTVRDAGALVRVAAGWLAPGGLLVLEHGARTAPPAAPDGFALVRQHRAGDSALAFYGHAGG